MNNDYLWDKSGEPDPELKELEDVLSTLRYQPRPLELPADIRRAPRSRFVPLLALAATITVALVAGNIWLHFHSQRQDDPAMGRRAAIAQDRAPNSAGAQPSNPGSKGAETATAKNSGSEGLATLAGANRVAHRLLRARKTASRRNIAPRDANPSDTLMAQNDTAALNPAEGEAAKEQLLLALRIASLKLNHAQRRTVGQPIPTNIRNQHKLG